MQTKYQTYVAAAIGAVAIVLIGGLMLALVGLYFVTPTAEAQTEPAPLAIPAAQGTGDVSRTITVVGEGKVKVQPDLAQANIGVEVVESDIKQATNKAAELMENLLATLKAQGVAENDIQTSYFNVWVERPYAPQGGPSGETIYHVNNNVMVTIRDLEKVTTILGHAIEVGANNINSVNFNIDDPSALRSRARQQAVENALAEAEELATLNGVEVGEVLSVSEVVGSGNFFVSEFAAAQGVGGGGSGPISPGEVEVSVQLQVTYAIK